MKQHRYRITVEHLRDAQGAPSTYNAPLTFEVGNHDDLFVVVDRVRGLADLSPDQATALAVGMKLFGEVMLENRKHPLFEDFFDQFVAFMKQLKKRLTR